MHSRMRMILLVLALTGALAGGPSGSPQTAASSSASPTLQETKDWLVPHLTSLSHSSRKTSVTMRTKKGKEPKEVDRQESNLTETVNGAVFDGCTLTLGQLSKGDDYSVTTVSTIPLGRLDQVSWKTETFSPVKTADGEDSTETTVLPATVVTITLQSSANFIAWRRRSTGSVPFEEARIPYEGRGSSLSIHSDDETMAPRLVNALNHAMGLCHVEAKPEPF